MTTYLNLEWAEIDLNNMYSIEGDIIKILKLEICVQLYNKRWDCTHPPSFAVNKAYCINHNLEADEVIFFFSMPFNTKKGKLT